MYYYFVICLKNNRQLWRFYFFKTSTLPDSFCLLISAPVCKCFVWGRAFSARMRIDA